MGKLDFLFTLVCVAAVTCLASVSSAQQYDRRHAFRFSRNHNVQADRDGRRGPSFREHHRFDPEEPVPERSDRFRHPQFYSYRFHRKPESFDRLSWLERASKENDDSGYSYDNSYDSGYSYNNDYDSGYSGGSYDSSSSGKSSDTAYGQSGGLNTTFLSGLLTDEGFVGAVRECKVSETDQTSVAAEWLRIVFHDCGTYDASDGSGGCDGSLALWDEKKHPANGGLQIPVVLLSHLKTQGASLADVFVAGGIVAVHECGGPPIPFYIGRRDATIANKDGMLPKPQQPFSSIHSLFKRMGLNMVDMIVLSTGAHTIGGMHKFVTPYIEKKFVAFDSTPEKFDGKIWSEVLEGLSPLPSDSQLSKNEGALKVVELLAKNEELFFEQFARSFVKLSWLGYKKDELQGPYWIGSDKGYSYYGKKDFPWYETLSEFKGILEKYDSEYLAGGSGGYGEAYVNPDSINYPDYGQCDASAGPYCDHSDPSKFVECPHGGKLVRSLPSGFQCVADQTKHYEFVVENGDKTKGYHS